MDEKGIPKPPPDLTFIQNDDVRASFWKWFSQVWMNFPRIRTYWESLTPSAVTAGSESVQTFTVTGLRTTDNVSVNKPTNQSGLDLVHAWVSADDTISLKYRNPSGGDITPTAETYRIVATRK